MAAHYGPENFIGVFEGSGRLLITLGILVVLILLLKWYQMIQYKLDRIN